MKNNIDSYRKRFLTLLESTIGDVKPLIQEQIKQGGSGDPYQYKKENGKYYYAKKGQENWTEQTKPDGIKAIATRIFGDPAPSTNTTPTNTTPTNTTPTNQNKTQGGKLVPEQSMVGKVYNFEKKSCKIEKAFKLPSGGFLVLPNMESGCRRNNGIVNGEAGYVYMSEPNGGSLMGWFEWSGNNWKDLGNGELAQPRTGLANISLSDSTTNTTPTNQPK